MIRAQRTPDGRLEQILPDGTTQPLADESDWARFDAITDEEAYQRALEDPDNPPLTLDRLATMRRVPNVKTLRRSLNLTQEEFARQFEINLRTLREWEQGVRHLDRTAVSYLTVIERNPEAVRQALHAEVPEHIPTAGESVEPKTKRVG
jgi:putative transcriptional regulator